MRLYCKIIPFNQSTCGLLTPLDQTPLSPWLFKLRILPRKDAVTFSETKEYRKDVLSTIFGETKAENAALGYFPCMLDCSFFMRRRERVSQHKSTPPLRQS